MTLPLLPVPSIAICGGGIAGLALATLLARDGLRPEVFEARSEAECRGEGAFITIAPNGVSALRALGLARAALREGMSTRMTEIGNRRGRRLAVVASPANDDDEDHEGSITIERGRLLALLIRAARRSGVQLHYGTALADIRETDREVVLDFEDAGARRFDLVVGADGLFSTVRERLFPHGPQPTYAGLVGIGGVGFVPGVAATDGVMRLTFGQKATFGYQKDGDGPVYWFSAYAAPAADLQAIDDPVVHLEFLRGLHADDPEPIPHILAAVPALDRYYPFHHLPTLPTWHTRRVVLMGDAAHAVAPPTGQGASLALEDAVVLAAALDEATMPVKAFARFESLRRPRMSTAMRIAQHKPVLPATGPVATFFRELLLPMLIPLGARQRRRLAAFRVDQAPLAVPG